MKFDIPACGPLDFPLSCYRYHVWGEDLANRYHDGCFRRVTEVAGRLWLYEVRSLEEDGSGLRVRVLTSDGGQEEEPTAEVIAAIQDEVRWMFSLEDEIEAFYRFAAERDPTLDTLCRVLRGYRVTRAPSLFEALVTAITAQQIHLPFAFKIRSRFIAAYGRAVTRDGETYYAFPEPATVAEASPEALRAMQFSTRKGEYIVALARAIANGELRETELRTLPNEEVIARLCRLSGIGRWTAEWALIRALGRSDVIPADDLGVQHAIARFYTGGARPSSAEARALAERWKPWRTAATYYLLAGMRLEPGVLTTADRTRVKTLLGGSG